MICKGLAISQHPQQHTARTQAGSLTLVPEGVPGFTVAKSTPIIEGSL